ncbi:deoxynucleotidyltransferase terminal-interacting protein 2 [Rhinoderma darwinii]|uniref:deoxynucleotidyltransferase terminal-interacting protein 2 n=1 Tax=Rhinoderma darwinii TaxID=43563 RepID=UPI003F67A672
MVATRRGTRVEPEDEGETSAPERTAEKVSSPSSPMQTRRSFRKDIQKGEYSTDEGTSRSPLKSDSVKPSTPITTRSRHRSGQSDAAVSEAESTASNTSTRRLKSSQSLGQLADSTRKLRSQGSALITEPIIESKEDTDLSEAESNCSSVSTARKKQPGTASRLRSTRSRKSILVLEPTSDVSEAESNSSSVLGLRNIATRSTRRSIARRSSSIVNEFQTEQTSDAESCSSGFSLQPLARRSSRRNTSKLQSDEVECVSKSNKGGAEDQETLKKTSPNARGVTSDALSSTGEQHVLSSPPRRPQKQPAIQEAEVITISDDENEPTRSDTANKIVAVEQPEADESPMTNEVDLSAETSAMSELQSSETGPEENIVPDQMLRLSEDSMEEEPAMEKSHFTNDNHAAEEKNENLQDVPESTNMAESMKICLFSDDSQKTESSDDDDDDRHQEDENIIEVEDDHEHIVDKRKSQRVLTRQLQNVTVDEPFVIDTAPGMDSSKKKFLEPGEEEEDDDDDDDDDEEEAADDHHKEDENIMEVEEDHEQVVDKRKSQRVLTKQLQNVTVDELFVIDTAPGMDSSKKKFLEPGEEEDDDDDDHHQEDENIMEEDHEQVVDKRKSQKVLTKQLQNVIGDELFVIDTAPGVDSSKKYFLEPGDDDEEDDDGKEAENEAGKRGKMYRTDDDDDEDFIDKDEDVDEEETLLNRPKRGFALSTSIDTGINLKQMGGLYINFDAEKPNPGPSLLSKMKKGNKKKDELLRKSIITPDFEKKESVPPYTESQYKLKKLRKEERDKTTGRGWFDMKAPELTDELKNDLKALKMRSAMDPKHFYKKNDRDGLPKYFQIGTVVDNPIDFYHSRIPKKQRKRTIVEELLADSEFRRYNKKKYKEIIAEKAARAEGKKNRKKKKFRT